MEHRIIKAPAMVSAYFYD